MPVDFGARIVNGTPPPPPARSWSWPRGRKLVPWLIPLAFLHGVLAALRWPMLWATSQMVLDYHFGFGKRGLVGTVLGWVAPPPYHYVTLARIGFIAFGIWLALLTAAGWRTVRADPGMAAAAMFLFLSAGFASLVCDAGYLEHFGLVLALLCLLLPAGLAWLPLRAALAIVAVLAHEANFLMFVPLIAFDAWFAAGAPFAWRGLTAGAGVLLPAGAATFYLGNIRTACDHARAMAYFQSKVRDFPIRQDSVDTLCRDGAWNLHFLQSVWHSGVWSVYMGLALVVVLPSTIFDLCVIARMARGRVVVILAAVSATISPLALLLLGADLVRFVTLMQVNSALILLSLSRRAGLPPGGALPAALRNPVWLGALAAYEIGTALVLTDASPMMKFPFVPLVQRLLDVLRGNASFVVIPPF